MRVIEVEAARLAVQLHKAVQSAAALSLKALVLVKRSMRMPSAGVVAAGASVAVER
jgi:hypothetical protein